ncbi:hypothetical protein I4F81_006577 [Pyropia yezoensis]|uniref:Uncharacterized protein n=1 Tax=Pyropia yezoensis TaxID=2788 RepID=A0ACC3C238_PYRYE|nr:hypothetical protein I4F81_006577 [Neopyropia yezoensis]
MDVTTVVGDSEPIESALRRFKKDVNKSGHLFELRRRRYFETTAEKRLRNLDAACGGRPLIACYEDLSLAAAVDAEMGRLTAIPVDHLLWSPTPTW